MRKCANCELAEKELDRAAAELRNLHRQKTLLKEALATERAMIQVAARRRAQDAVARASWGNGNGH